MPRIELRVLDHVQKGTVLIAGILSGKILGRGGDGRVEIFFGFFLVGLRKLHDLGIGRHLRRHRDDPRMLGSSLPSAPRRCRVIVTSARASDMPQFFGCVSSTPLMNFSGNSLCVWPKKITSIPGTCSARSDTAFSPWQLLRPHLAAHRIAVKTRVHDHHQQIQLRAHFAESRVSPPHDRLKLIALVVIGDFPVRNSRRHKSHDADAHAFHVLDDVGREVRNASACRSA